MKIVSKGVHWWKMGPMGPIVTALVISLGEFFFPFMCKKPFLFFGLSRDIKEVSKSKLVFCK